MKLKHLIILLFIALSYSFAGPGSNSGSSTSKFRAYLGCSFTDTSFIDAATFKRLMTQPLCAKDSVNNIYKVKSFEITYAERGLYQDDTTGAPIIFTDYTADNFTGDMLTPQWIKIFNERLYKSDTIYFDRVICTTSDNKNFICRPMKVVIK